MRIPIRICLYVGGHILSPGSAEFGIGSLE